MKKLVLVLSAAAAVLLSAAPARAGTIIDGAVAGLRSDPVYVQNGAGTLNITPDAVNALRKQIASGTVRIYLAVLPSAAADETGGNADKVPPAIGSQLGQGVVGTVAGNKFRAGSSGVFTQTGMAARLATEAFDAHRSEGLAAVLRDFVARVQHAATPTTQPAAPAGAGTSTPPAEPKKAHHVPVGLIAFAVLLIAAVGTALYFLLRRREPEPEYTPYAYPRTSTRRRGDIDHGETRRVEVHVDGARFYPGGYHAGLYYGPGWYPGSFMDGVLWGSMMNTHHDHDSGERGNDTRPAAPSGTSDYTADDYTPTTDHGTSGGGGDFNDHDDVSTYTPPATYDPPASSGFDFGGGSNWGSGGGDSGGGGGDF